MERLKLLKRLILRNLFILIENEPYSVYREFYRKYANDIIREQNAF